jgi:hypothetical protein
MPIVSERAGDGLVLKAIEVQGRQADLCHEVFLYIYRRLELAGAGLVFLRPT